MTDHVGELVRFADRGQAADVRARLAEFGYDSVELSGAAQAAALKGRWYAPGDLSREEAQVVAGNITPAFARGQGIDAAQARALEERVRSALFDCFTGTAIPSAAPSLSMPRACGEAVAAAADGVVDAGVAAELGALVERRLASA